MIYYVAATMLFTTTFLAQRSVISADKIAPGDITVLDQTHNYKKLRREIKHLFQKN
jgi:hypothetical protein